MAWLSLNTIPLLNMAGILLDIVGAVLVASEVLNQFRGKQYGATLTFDDSFTVPPVETEEHKRWAHLRNRNMKRGLVLLVLGFLLQILANALQIRALP